MINAMEQTKSQEIYNLLTDLAGIDTYDTNLRDSQEAHRFVELFVQRECRSPTAPAVGAPVAKPWDTLTAMEKAPSLIEQLDDASERFTRYTNDPIDGLLSESARVIEALATAEADMVPRSRLAAMECELQESADKLRAVQQSAGDEIRRLNREASTWNAALTEYTKREFAAKADDAPVFWYRPCGDGLYEGPVHNNSTTGKMLRDEKPGEWVPLYLAPPAASAEGVNWLNGDPNAPGAFGGPPAASLREQEDINYFAKRYPNLGVALLREQLAEAENIIEALLRDTKDYGQPEVVAKGWAEKFLHAQRLGRGKDKP